MENGNIESQESTYLIKKCCDYFTKYDIDSLVLGCTHYSFLKNSLIQLTKGNLGIIDTSEAVALHLKTNIKKLGLEREVTQGKEATLIQILTSGNAEKFSSIASYLLKESYIAKKQSINFTKNDTR